MLMLDLFRLKKILAQQVISYHKFCSVKRKYHIDNNFVL